MLRWRNLRVAPAVQVLEDTPVLEQQDVRETKLLVQGLLCRL